MATGNWQPCEHRSLTPENFSGAENKIDVLCIQYVQLQYVFKYINISKLSKPFVPYVGGMAPCPFAHALDLRDLDFSGCFFMTNFFHMGVSKISGTPKSSILIGVSLINHPFWGTPIFGNAHIPQSDRSRVGTSGAGCFYPKTEGLDSLH